VAVGSPCKDVVLMIVIKILGLFMLGKLFFVDVRQQAFLSAMDNRYRLFLLNF